MGRGVELRSGDEHHLILFDFKASSEVCVCVCVCVCVDVQKEDN